MRIAYHAAVCVLCNDCEYSTLCCAVLCLGTRFAGTREPQAPDSYCYTSGETNWSNNPVLFPRKWFHERLRQVALKDFERNNMFEFNVMLEWLAWKPPALVCSSMQGIFTHKEVDQ